MDNIVAFIFARGGSKGLPRKNLLPFGGIPLIAHSINTARALSRINRVVVSTDDEEIAEIAVRAGAEVPFMRPKELASDTAPEWLAWQHAIKTLKAQGDSVDVFLSMPPTSPLRTPEDIDCCIDTYFESRVDIVVTVREAERSPYFNMVKKKEDGSVCLAVEGNFHRRQDAPVLYDMTTVAYVARADFILQTDRIFDGKVKAVQIPSERALDIDTKLDFVVGEALIGKLDNSIKAKAL